MAKKAFKTEDFYFEWGLLNVSRKECIDPKRTCIKLRASSEKTFTTIEIILNKDGNVNVYETKRTLVFGEEKEDA